MSTYRQAMSKFKIARCVHGCNELGDASCILCLLCLCVKLCSVKVACCMLGVASLRRSRCFIRCLCGKMLISKMARCAYGCSELRGTSCIPCGLSLYAKPSSVKVAYCMIGLGSFRQSRSFICFTCTKNNEFQNSKVCVWLQ